MTKFWKRANAHYNREYGLPLLKKLAKEKKVNFIRDFPEGLGG